ncbi:hypothetical protein SEMRO_2312_G322870.1 [Seminavis robusta]|uniref:Uncharacterized protein n=1 Tax=Seminavis robusta TaxID=568900 RepID=A0A9N8EXS7_9STRA|nr:hypothetical protein SEMRO_2312_G322870.1 [Seminavis robusta]|eukprot:Sro2312_g322870.1 n/a (361) ;mRNA; f:11098-12180
MSPTTPSDHFTKETLTSIPPDEKPTYATLKIIHQEMNANAMAIPSTNGGGHYGHLALVIPAAAFTALPNAIAWVAPIHPGESPIHGVAPTAAQISENNRVYEANEKKFLTYKATETALKKQLLEAIPETFIKSLKHEMYGYAQITTLELLTHLDTTYGNVNADDLEDNMKRMHAQWSPTQSIEDLYNQLKDAQKFAADHDTISDKMAVRAAIKNLTNSGVFTDAIKDWRKKPDNDQTMAALQTHFTEADKERRRILTSKEVGYANKAAAKQPANDKANIIMNGSGTVMYYCWTHGLGPNSNHTSRDCTKKAPGHRSEATGDDMLGGCCIIRRKAGERAVYRRPQRQERENDENTPPANRT